MVGMRSIVHELSVGRSRLSFLLSALLFIVTKVSTVPTFNWVVWRLVPAWWLPFSQTSLVCFSPLANSGSCALGSADYVALCFLDRILFPRPTGSRPSDHLAHCSLVERDFRRPTISTKDWKRRENSPLQGWPIWSCRIVGLSQQGIFAPFRHCQWWCW